MRARTKIFSNMKLAVKMGLGFACAILVLAAAVGITYAQVTRINDMTSRIGGLRVPTSGASLMMLNGINHSPAALRGWMLLGKESFKTERRVAWEREIDARAAAMSELSRSWWKTKDSC